MAITWSDVTVIAPELSSVPSPSQTVFIADAYAQMNAGIWGGYLDRGAKYLAAHLATMSNRRGRPALRARSTLARSGSPTPSIRGRCTRRPTARIPAILDTLPGARGPQAAC